MSTLRLTTLSNQGGTASVPSDTVINGTAKAWVNFNGTGTVAIRGSFNVSSITDNGTGDYTVNFSTSMPDVNYSYTANHTGYSGSIGWSFPFISSTSALRVLTFGNVEATSVDPTTVTVSVFR
jgi:hypothetical protein